MFCVTVVFGVVGVSAVCAVAVAVAVAVGFSGGFTMVESHFVRYEKNES